MWIYLEQTYSLKLWGSWSMIVGDQLITYRWLLWLIKDCPYLPSSPHFPVVPSWGEKGLIFINQILSQLAYTSLSPGTEKIVLLNESSVLVLLCNREFTVQRGSLLLSSKYKEACFASRLFIAIKMRQIFYLVPQDSALGFAAKTLANNTGFLWFSVYTFPLMIFRESVGQRIGFGCSWIAWTNTIVNTPQHSIPKSYFFSVNCMMAELGNGRREKIRTAVL